MSKSFLEDRCRYVRWVKLHFVSLICAQVQEMNVMLYLGSSCILFGATDKVSIFFSR
jgi:hypothetical protein